LRHEKTSLLKVSNEALCLGKWRPLRERIGRRAVDSFNRPYLAIRIRQQLVPQRFGLLGVARR